MKKLTNYDKYMLEKKNNSVAPLNYADNSSTSNEYDDYLINELRRTTPSDKKVMAEEEFYRMKNESISYGYTAAVAKAEKEPRFRLKKGGKIFLVVYVILMIALASILIVTNTTRDVSFDGISFNQSAGAADKEEGSADTVKAMTIEEEFEGETNWFDELCDSLNN